MPTPIKTYPEITTENLLFYTGDVIQPLFKHMPSLLQYSLFAFNLVFFIKKIIIIIITKQNFTRSYYRTTYTVPFTHFCYDTNVGKTVVYGRSKRAILGGGEVGGVEDSEFSTLV